MGLLFAISVRNFTAIVIAQFTSANHGLVSYCPEMMIEQQNFELDEMEDDSALARKCHRTKHLSRGIMSKKK
jgi:hypothetical protein